MTTLLKAAFLDRDGVINLDHGYVYRWEDFEFVPGAIAAMQRLQQAGYALVVVTNQSGIARGLYGEADFQALSQRLAAHLAEQGVALAAIEHCPHLPEAPLPAYRQHCDCRKPAPGMLLRAATAQGLDLAGSVMFGDKPSDLEAAAAAGLRQGFLLAQNGEGPLPVLPASVSAVPGFAAVSAQSLEAAVAQLLG